jgi:hypothetical protein
LQADEGRRGGAQRLEMAKDIKPSTVDEFAKVGVNARAKSGFWRQCPEPEVSLGSEVRFRAAENAGELPNRDTGVAARLTRMPALLAFAAIRQDSLVSFR